MSGNAEPKVRLDRDRQVLRIILLEGTTNAAMLAAKLFVGLSTGSMAVIADAVHSLTDVFNNVVAWIVLRLSTKPADTKHPYGHRKFETVAVFGLASLLVVLAFELAMQAITRSPQPIATDGLALALMIGVLVANIGLASWQRSWAKKLDSKILYADASHTLADVLTTVVVILGWQLSALGYVWVDQVCAVAVSLLIFYLAFKLFQQVIPTLVDESAIDPVRVVEITREIIGVQSVERVRSRWIGEESAIDMTVKVPYDLSTSEAHEIADEIEARLESEFSVRDVTIHIEPA